MFASWFSPLAPAAVLLLGAFILSVVVPRLPERWRSYRIVKDFGASIMVGLAILTLLGTRLTVGADASGAGLELLSGWNFSTVESVATLSVRADVISLSFVLLTLLVLLAVTLAYPPLTASVNRGEHKREDGVASWLVMGAGACVLFVSANGLTIGYAVVAFDLLIMLFWLGRGYPDLGVGRLFLGVFTASGLVLATLNAIAGTLLFGIALWLRLGFYPLAETIKQTRLQNHRYLVYLSLSFAVGMYLVIRVSTEPLPPLVLWLTALTMLLSGLLTWLSDERPMILTWLMVTEALLILMADSLSEGAATAYALGLILSVVALWITPCWGKPKLTERAWSWPYLPAAGATLTLLGVPFSLSWPARSATYQSLLLPDNVMLLTLVILAEGLALSGLVRYWRLVWRGADQSGIQAVAGVVIMVPFLIPGLAPFIFSVLTDTELPSADFEESPWPFVAMVIVAVAAVGVGYYRTPIMSRLKLSPATQAELARLFQTVWPWGEAVLSRVSKFALRVEVLLQGQHYMGWALFTALVAVVIILLGT